MEFWEIVIIFVGTILSIAGLIGCILPVVPGPPLNYLAILLIHFTDLANFSTRFLIVYFLLNIAVIVFDFILPVYGAKHYGASRKGIWGSVIGLIIGLFFFPPFGIIIGTLIGAIVGELIAGKSESQALKAGFATFIASLIMVVAKFVLSGIMTFYFVKGIVDNF
ncbi:MAG: DUF456 domain-containing protein [Ignavibacteriales bacterium]|jgi:uncharacterized protein YqgC (DUF456 family)|nr:MAG: DUF456 domain-containing protein [Ignavibacteriales bacterium]